MEQAILIAVIAALPGVLASLLVYRSSGRATDINAKAQELGWVKELRQDAIDTRKELEVLQTKVADLNRQLTATQREADHWFSKFDAVTRVVHRPGVTLDLVREMVGPPTDPPSPNGSQLLR